MKESGCSLATCFSALELGKLVDVDDDSFTQYLPDAGSLAGTNVGGNFQNGSTPPASGIHALVHPSPWVWAGLASNA